MRPERLYLLDIQEAAEKIAVFITGKDKAAFLEDELLQSGVPQKLTIIGEAASRIPRELRERYPEIPWSDIVAFRNIAIHEYFAVDWTIVWNAATVDAPALREQVASILADEAPGDEPPEER